MMGIGTKASARNPSSEFPQPRPRLSNMAGPASGRKAPTSDLVAVKVALAEAAYAG